MFDLIPKTVIFKLLNQNIIVNRKILNVFKYTNHLRRWHFLENQIRVFKLPYNNCYGFNSTPILLTNIIIWVVKKSNIALLAFLKIHWLHHLLRGKIDLPKRYVFGMKRSSFKQQSCWYYCMDALHGHQLNVPRKSLTATTQEYCEQYWTSPGSSTATKPQLYSYLPPITRTIKVRQTRHAGHYSRSRDELIRDILL